MLKKLKGLFDYNRKEIARLAKIAEQINALEPKIKKLSDAKLKVKTKEFKKKIEKGTAAEDLLVEAFAVVREAAFRVLGERHYDVQLMAGIALFEGKIAEQKTGEGKTLTATAPLYLRALEGKGAHLVTVNDYLARVGTGWMGPVYEFLGLSVSCIIPYQSFLYDSEYKGKSTDQRLRVLKPVERRVAYEADITYGTNNEFGFDYLRDNMVQEKKAMVQRGHYYAIVDEIDFALIDEARTPLIISSPAGDSAREYSQYAALAAELAPDSDYAIDEKEKSAVLTEFGIRKVERKLGFSNLYEEDFDTIHYIENALKARTLFRKDKDYVVKDGQVIIVDEFTGRLMQGRRWSDGLHQAVEAKEGAKIQQESKTWATITFQNYFRLYEKLSGMTGTAATEEEEFKKIYDLDVLVLPTNKPITRADHADMIYKNQRAKYAAIAGEIEDCFKRGQPVLVGTTSIEKNEMISRYLRKKKIPHQILNAKNHEKEAEIIADAGKAKAVTVATNMAGRGVDIVLGGEKPEKGKLSKERYQEEMNKWQEQHDRVLELGGLHVLGTERHEARRIDNQLRGRGGRQGDAGSSRFFVGLDDDLMRVFGGEQIAGLMTRFNVPENVPLSHPMVSRVLAQIQVKVEGFNFDIRKSLVEYDDVVNKQREIIYKKRIGILTLHEQKALKLKKEVLSVLKEEVYQTVSVAVDPVSMEVDLDKVVLNFCEILPIEEGEEREKIKARIKGKAEEEIKKSLYLLAKSYYDQREKTLGKKITSDIEKSVYLFTVDNHWVEHLTALDDLKEGVRLRGYAQRDPLVEYRKESFDLFQTLLTNINYHLARRVLRVRVQVSPQKPKQAIEGRGQIVIPQAQKSATSQKGSRQASAEKQSSAPKVKAVVSGKKKLGRNDPCFCGSGKKWKKCHYPETG